MSDAEAERVLRLDEAHFRTLFNDAPVAIALFDPVHWRVLDANPATEEMLGYTRDELRSTDTVRFVHPDDLLVDAEPLARLLAGQIDSYKFERRYIRKDGGVVWSRGNVSLIRDAGGAPAFLLSVIDDISDQKRFEADLLAAREAAEHASRARSDFIASASHDLRTPIHILLGYEEMLRDSTLDQRQREILDRIGAVTRNLLSLTNDLLDFTKIDAGRVEFVLQPFDLRSFLDQSLEPFVRSAEQRQLAFRWHVADGLPPTIVGDANRLRQVLINLVDNAIKFTERGSVCVFAAAGAQPHTVRFRVADTGTGLEAWQIGQLFQPFTQLHGQHHGGTGLGLAIAKRLMEAMGGTVGADCQAGQGSTFWFEIPIGGH